VSRRTGVLRRCELMAKDASEPARPYVYRVEVSNHRFLAQEAPEHRVCSGKGWTLDAARSSALGEGVERYAGGCWDAGEILHARRADLPDPALDPRQLVLYAAEQYADLPYAPYTDESVLGWLRGRSLATGEEIHLPALAVLMSYEVQRPQELLFPVTSNGLAAGSTLAGAVLSAALEVIERDAFMAAWLLRLPCRRIDPAGHPEGEVRALVEAYRRRGVAIELYQLPTDHGAPVFAAAGYQEEGGEGPAAVFGLGADLDPARAARKAVLEVGQVRPALRMRTRRLPDRRRMEELAEDPRQVAALEDHDLLYAHPAALPALAFLRERPLAEPPWGEPAPEGPPCDRLARLLAALRAVGGDILYVDLTPLDVGALGLHAARAVLPGFQPIDFGWRERRLGGDRLFELARRLGLAAGRTPIASLNPAPHPIS
jgi:ribosomal protein S12 methylthiotransferase accessory factor